MIRRLVLIVLLAAALLVPAALPATAATPVVAAWKAAIGSSGYNGSATLTTNATGTGSFRILAKRLVPRASYPVEIRAGGCSGTKVGTFASTVASTTGTIARTYTLTTAQAAAVVRYGQKVYARIGSATRVRCGFLGAVVPTGATSGIAIRVPAGRYSGAVELLTVQAFEAWTVPPDSYYQPDPGNVFVTALVRIDAVTAARYNPFDFRVRGADGLQYDHAIGRDPALHSGDLASGTFVAGWLTFEIPAAQASSLTLTYSPTSGVTALVRLTPLPLPPGSSPSPTPPPSPSPAACVPGVSTYICMGQLIDFGGYAVTVDWVTGWAGTSTVKPAAGKVFVAVSVTFEARANVSPPAEFSFSVRGRSGQDAYPMAIGRTPAFEPPTSSSAFGLWEWGYVTFEVPSGDVSTLVISVNSTPVQLY